MGLFLCALSFMCDRRNVMTIELLVKIKNELEEDFGRNLDGDMNMADAIMWSENCLCCPSGLMEELMEQIPEDEQEDYDDMMQTFIGALLAGHLLDLQKNLHSSEDTKGQYSFNFDLPVNDYHIGFAIGWTKKEAYIGIGILMFIIGLFVGYSLFF